MFLGLGWQRLMSHLIKPNKSRANVHMIGLEHSLSHFVPLANSSQASTASGYALDIIGKGAMTFNENKISNILYILCAQRNFLSIGKIIDLGHTVYFNSTHCVVFDKEKRVCMHGLRTPTSCLYNLVSHALVPLLLTCVALLPSDEPLVSPLQVISPYSI